MILRTDTPVNKQTKTASFAQLTTVIRVIRCRLYVYHSNLAYYVKNIITELTIAFIQNGATLQQGDHTSITGSGGR